MSIDLQPIQGALARRRIDFVVAPFTGARPPSRNRRSQFSATINRTAQDLARELDQLGATECALLLDLRPEDIRQDGMPRSYANPRGPAVGIAFDSKHGPLLYATGHFEKWLGNLRAIALGLEALRAVDRYGISSRGEQYVGYKAIPQSTDGADLIQTREQAIEFLGRWMVPGKDDLQSATRKALFETHPDQGGDTNEFRKVVRAKELVAG